MNEKTIRIAALAGGLIGLFMALFYLGPTVNDDVKTMIATVGFFLVAIAILYSFQRKEEVTKDERTTRITNKSLAWSWWLTYLYITALFWLSHDGIVKINVEYILFFMAFSAIIAKMFLARRGDP